MALYLCVDCGGTKTAASIADSGGAIIATALAGPSNIASLSLPPFIDVVSTVVSRALAQALPQGAPPIPHTPNVFVAAWFGVSGADSPGVIARITPALAELLALPPGPRLTVANDTHLLAAPMRMHADVSCAVAVIVGTGSIAVSFRKVEGGYIEQLARVGGWGWMLGDEGGGYDVGREAVRQILHEADLASVAGAATPVEGTAAGGLVARALAHFQVAEVMEILQAVYGLDQNVDTGRGDVRCLPREKRLSTLPPLVFDLAFNEQDALALRVLRTCARKLAAQVALLMGAPGEGRERCVRAEESVVVFGGSLVGDVRYRTMVLDELQTAGGHVFQHVTFVDDVSAVGAQGLALAFVDNA